MRQCPSCLKEHSPTAPCDTIKVHTLPWTWPSQSALDYRQVRISALHAACVLHAPAAAEQDVDFDVINEAVLQTANQFVDWIESDVAEAPPAEAKREDVVGGILRPGEVPHSPAFDEWKEDIAFGPGPDVQFKPTEHDKS